MRDLVVPGHGHRLLDVHGLSEVRLDHHQQLRLIPLEGGGAEQRAQDRDLAEEGHLLHRGADVVGEQPGHGEALAVLQPDRGLAVACPETGDLEALQRDRHRAVGLADLGEELEVDRPLAQHRGHELQPHAELLEGDAHRLGALICRQLAQPGHYLFNTQFVGVDNHRVLSRNHG